LGERVGAGSEFADCGEAGFEAVEDCLWAEGDGAVWFGGVVGCGCGGGAGSEVGELGGDLLGPGHEGLDRLLGVPTPAADAAVEGDLGGGSRCVADDEDEDGGRRAVGVGGREAGLLVDREAVVVVPELPRRGQQMAPEGLPASGAA
jgi:hypothetical protein